MYWKWLTGLNFCYSFSPMCTLMRAFWFPDWLNLAVSHNWHLYGFSPLWILLCTTWFQTYVNCLPQTVHSNGFSPEWLHSCISALTAFAIFCTLAFASMNFPMTTQTAAIRKRFLIFSTWVQVLCCVSHIVFQQLLSLLSSSDGHQSPSEHVVTILTARWQANILSLNDSQLWQ